MEETGEMTGLLGELRHLGEAGRTISGSNTEKLREIRKRLMKMAHHPQAPEALALLDQLLAAAEPKQVTESLTSAEKAAIVDDLKGMSTHDVSATVRRIAQWAAKGTVLTGFTRADMEYIYRAAQDQLDNIAEEEDREPADHKGLKWGTSEALTESETEIQEWLPKTVRDILKRNKEDEEEDMEESQGYRATALGHVLEAVEPGKVWRVVVIESGVSENGNYWSPELLESSAAMFENAWVYYNHDSDKERREYPVRRVEDRVGFLTNVEPVREGQSVRLEADFNVVKDTFRSDIQNAVEMGRPDYVQFSVNAVGRDTEAREPKTGRRIRHIQSIEAVRSVDAVTDAAAGGRLVRLVASNDTRYDMPTLTIEELKALIAEQIASEGAAQEASCDSDEDEGDTEEARKLPPVEHRFKKGHNTQTEADSGIPNAAPPFKKGGGQEDEEEEDEEEVEEARTSRGRLSKLQKELADLKDQITRDSQAQKVTEAVKAAGLPAPASARLTQLLEAQVQAGLLTDASILKAIKDERSYVAKISGSPTPVSAFRESAQLRSGHPSNAEYHMLRLRGMFFREAQKDRDGHTIEPFRSLRESYWQWHPHVDPFGGSTPFDILRGLRVNYDSMTDSRRLQESLTTAQWGQIVADVMYQTLTKAYTDLPYNEWRNLVSDFESPNDFRSRRYITVGGYGSLPTVGEGAAYQPLTSPGDEEETYAVTKRGGLEQSITLEMIANDQVGALSRIPGALARAAKRTLYKFVLDMVTTTNGNMGDGVALYHSGHSNTGTTALSVTGLWTTQQAMRDQTARLESAEILGPRNRIKYIIIPNEMEMLAKRILSPSSAYAYGLTPAATTPGANVDTDTNLDPHAWANSGIEVIVYDYLTDTNDWWAVADPKEVPTLVMGFFGGREEPELFMQDDPNAGIGFSNDTQAVKIRHIYGAAPLDYRSFYRQVVT